MNKRTLTVVITKLNETVTIEAPGSSVEWLLQHGLDAKINDAHAALKREAFKTDAELAEAIHKKVDPIVKQIAEGTLPPRRTAVVTEIAAMEALAKKYNMPLAQVQAMFANAAPVVEAAPEPAPEAPAPESTLIPAPAPAPEKPAGNGRAARR